MWIKTLQWLKDNLFYSIASSIVSVILLSLFAFIVQYLFSWMILDGVCTATTADSCRTGGFCFAFLIDKFNLIIFGLYPREELWRPQSFIVLFLSLSIYSAYYKNWKKSTIYAWLILAVVSFVLLRGGMLNLPLIQVEQFGGLPLTIVLAFIGITISYPLGILLALGRRSKMPIIRICSVTYIELIRGVPMISLLFMASVMFPLLMPEGVTIDKIFRAQIAMIMFASAYMAEVVRGGLQSIDYGQYEAADSLGLNYYRKMRHVVLPQALKVVIPPTINTIVSFFKDTSLVMIIALYDLMNTTKVAIADAKWLGFAVEAYCFTAFIYFIFCFSMSRYSKWLELKFQTS